MILLKNFDDLRALIGVHVADAFLDFGYGHNFVFGMTDPIEKFIEHRSHQHGNLRGDGGSVGIKRMARHDGAVDDRRPDQGVGHPADIWQADARVLVLHRSAGLNQFLVGQFLELRDLRTVQTKFGEKVRGDFGGAFRAGAARHGAALYDGAMKQAFGRGHNHQSANFSSSAGLAKDSDIGRIAAKMCDVVADPLEGGHEVKHSKISRAGIRLAVSGEVQMAEHTDAMIETDYTDVAAATQSLTVVGL